MNVKQNVHVYESESHKNVILHTLLKNIEVNSLSLVLDREMNGEDDYALRLKHQSNSTDSDNNTVVVHCFV